MQGSSLPARFYEPYPEAPWVSGLMLSMRTTPDCQACLTGIANP